MSGDIFDSHNLGDATGIRAEARMRRLDPGQNPMCDDLTIGNYKVCLAGFMGQSCPPHRVFQVSYSHRLRPPWAGMLLCISAFLAQEPPGASFIRGLWLRYFPAVSTEISLWRWRQGRGPDQDIILHCFFYSQLSPFFLLPVSQVHKMAGTFCSVVLSSETIFSICTARHLTDPCPLPFQEGKWRSEEPALLFFRFLLI